MKYQPTTFFVLFGEDNFGDAEKFSRDQFFNSGKNPVQNNVPVTIAGSPSAGQYAVIFTLYSAADDVTALTELVQELAEQYGGTVDSDEPAQPAEPATPVTGPQTGVTE
jgi:hypothetical protein